MTYARPQVGLLIVDLDDTLWTWFDAWHKSFTALLTEIQSVTGIQEHTLIPAIKDLHEQKGTAEYSWLVDELPLLKAFTDGQKPREVFDSALHAQNSARKHNTKLYPGVRSTLEYIRSNGVKIVAYTESLSFWTEWRMRTTGLDGLIDILYSSPDHDFPEGETTETVRTLPDEEYGLKNTVHKNVARGIAKPDPKILREIQEAHGVPGRSTVYIGDSLDRDVEMAQKVGLIGVHAKYGENHHRPEYDLLRAVTHWKPSAVEKERSQDPQVKVVPDYILNEGFFELLAFFDFATQVDVDSHLQVWKETVSVQMHFNDIGWRIRALALTVLTFTLGAIGFVFVNLESAHLGPWEISPAFFLPLLGMGLWCAFWFTDRGWFHKLLKGSVLEGATQERILSAHGVPTNLGGEISKASPINFKQWKKNGQPRVWQSSDKLNAFYWIGLVLLGLTMVGIALYTPLTGTEPATPAPVVNNNITVVPPGPMVPAPSSTPNPTR